MKCSFHTHTQKHQKYKGLPDFSMNAEYSIFSGHLSCRLTKIIPATVLRAQKGSHVQKASVNNIQQTGHYVIITVLS